MKLGTIVDVESRTTSKMKIGRTTDHWYRIKTQGKSGWIFGGLLHSYDSANAGIISLGIARQRMQRKSTSFLEWSELSDFCREAMDRARDAEDKAELGLCQLTAASRAGNARRQDPWFEQNKSIFFFHELAAQYAVRPELMWKLHDKYKRTSHAERIAFAASQLMTGGECEGFLECSLGRWLLTDGRYMELYPGGPGVPRILRQLNENLSYYLTQEIPDEKGVANDNIKRTQAVLSRVRNADALRDRILSQLEKIRAKHN